MLRKTIEAFTTASALEHLRMYNLDTLSKIEIVPMEYGHICVTFCFSNYIKIDVPHAFCVGYRGEGPYGLYDVMKAAGFPNQVAQRVFTVSRYEKSIWIK